MPPGIWWIRIAGSMMLTGLLTCFIFLARLLKNSAIVWSASKSTCVAYSVSLKIVTIVSTGGCEEKPASGEMAQSMAPAPARTAST